MPMGLPSSGTTGLVVSPSQERYRLAAELQTLLGSITRLWTPDSGETTTSTDLSVNGATLTYDATKAGAYTAQGYGHILPFNGSSNYGSYPDAADLTFSNGSADSAFSLLFCGSITDTAADRTIISKWASGASEWDWVIDSAADRSRFRTRDETVGVSSFRQANAAQTMGAMTTLGVSYTPGAAATNHSGTVLYQNGAAVASTATNNASYVTMRNQTTVVEIGSSSAHASGFFQGSMGLVAIVPKAMTAQEMWVFHQLCRGHFGF